MKTIHERSIEEKTEFLSKVMSLINDVETFGKAKLQAQIGGFDISEPPSDLPNRLSECEKALSPNEYNTPEQWAKTLNTERIRPIVNWLEGIGMDMFDDIRFFEMSADEEETKND